MLSLGPLCSVLLKIPTIVYCMFTMLLPFADVVVFVSRIHV